MVPTASRVAPPLPSDWYDDVDESVREIEVFYKTRTDIPHSVRRDTAKECLQMLEANGGFETYTLLNIWDGTVSCQTIDSSSIRTSHTSEICENPESDSKQTLALKASNTDNSAPCIHQQAVSPSTETGLPQLLGQILLQAGLITTHQLNVVLTDAHYREDLKFGEILAIRGWLHQETADFFADILPRLAQDDRQQPIGQYLKEAKLLCQEQIDSVLQAQRYSSTKFGEGAVAKQYIKPQTLEVVLQYLPCAKTSK